MWCDGVDERKYAPKVTWINTAVQKQRLADANRGRKMSAITTDAFRDMGLRAVQVS